MTVDAEGLVACSRYSFAPNSLHYCGPERQNDMLGYVTGKHADEGLVEILHRFETLYPYLVVIASENKIKDPFDRRVVEAYWLGNRLLDRVRTRTFAFHIADTMNMKKRLKKKQLNPMMDQIIQLGAPQHNFHVLNIFVRTGHHAVPHTLSTMDQCRISWGKVVDTQKQSIVSVRPLVYHNKRLTLGKPEQRIVIHLGVKPQKGDWVSIHWGYVCDILTPQKRLNLAYYTQKALAAANYAQVASHI